MSVLAAVSRAGCPLRAQLGGGVDVVARVVPRSERGGQNRLDHWPDRAGIGRVLFHHVACRLHGAAVRMREDDDKRRSEHRCAVLDRAERSRVDEVAGVAGDEQLPDPLAAENEFRRDAAIGAGDHRRPRRLVPSDRGALCGQVDRAQLRIADIARIAFLERGERLVRRERRRRAFGRPRRVRRAGERVPASPAAVNLRKSLRTTALRSHVLHIPDRSPLKPTRLIELENCA